MTRILVTGVSGLLGLNFALAVDGKDHYVIGVANTASMRWASFANIQAELTEPGRIEKLITTHKPDVILHCAAIAILETCEANPELAEKVNARLPSEIALACRKHGIRMIQISTDAVFDGTRGNYSESDAPNPINIYARTKLEGERQVLENNPDALVTRVNFYGWSAAGNRSLAENFVYKLEKGEKMLGFTDIQFSPMNVLDLADMLLEAEAKQLSGLYHLVGSEPMSKYQFGVRIAQKFGFDPSLIQPVSVMEGDLQTPRSPNLTLCTEKITKALGHELPPFDAGLQKFYDQYRRGYPQFIKTLV